MRPDNDKLGLAVYWFQSTHSLRSATVSTLIIAARNEFQSTHSLRSATSISMVRSVGIPVSIHALLAECDSLRHVGFVCHRVVSIHALLAECDRTLPEKLIPSASFNPRTPCGVRPVFRSLDGKELRFQSTHSLRSATKSRVIPSRADEFQSTHSLRSATLGGDELQVLFAVSIHALLAECDDADFVVER